ncbi:nucleic acid-binding protein [Lactarius hatsudake]|nr:nucleic acid-binding protein [Lactarius hatsudake]
MALQSPILELLQGFSKQGQQKSESEKDKAEITQWTERAAQPNFAEPDALPSLDALLVPRTYLVGNYLTAADVAVYGALQPTFARLQPAQYHSYPSLSRYFDHIQSRPSVRKSAEALSPAFDLVRLDFSTATSHRTLPKRAEKDAAPTSTPIAIESAVVKKAGGSEGKPPKTKEKKQGAAAEKDGKKTAADNGKATTPAGAEDAGPPIPSMIDLRVGHIVDVKKHPDADSLYVEQIDFGEETGPRTVVSGLVNYIPIEQMQDKWLVGVCNLKPANMRGVKSFAMVLCATSKDGKEAGIEIIQPPPNSKPGDRIYFDGPDYQDKAPLSQLNPKKKIFETIQPGLTTLETREAAWVDPVTRTAHRIRTKEGVCLAPTLVGASLS